MKTVLLTAFTFLILFGCNIQDPPDVEIILRDSIDTDVTIKLENQIISPVSNNNFYSTYSITNNLNSQLDSVKVTFTGTSLSPSIYSFKPMRSKEQAFVTVVHSTGAQVRVIAEWWPQ